MDLTIYDIIRRPVVTEKATLLVNKLRKVVLEVHPEANAPLIAEALKKLFGVEVKKINIVVRKGKIRTFKRMKSKGNLSKRAIITLKDVESFDKLIQSGSGQFADQAQHSITSPDEQHKD